MSVQSVKSRPIIIGLTGGIASGKTTATSYFKQLHIPLIDSDEIVRDLWQNNKNMVSKIESEFSFSIKNSKDKQKLAYLIFHDETLRDKLNQIVHPYVFEQIEKEKRNLENEAFIVIDMPLLYEVGYQKSCDKVCVVYVDYQTQIQRLMNRDELNKDEAKIRIASQISLDEKRKKADCVLDNSQSRAHLYAQIDSFFKELRNEK